MEQITGRTNPLLSHIRKLNTSRAYRRAQGEFPCEGPKLLAEALRWGAAVTTAVFAQGTSLPPLPETVRLVEVPQALLEHICDTETPQGVLFLCRIPALTLAEPLSARRLLVLDGVQDPGNVGTIWRTADAFQLDGLVLLPGCADPFSPKTVRASMGACFRLPVWEADRDTLAAALAVQGLPLYGTALREDTVDVREMDLSAAAVVIGSEGKGVSNETLSLCAKTIQIPMSPRCESLNAAVAASVVAWEMYR